jgi:hypothetical protein
MTTDDFIGPDADAGVDPGYSNDANNHQTPFVAGYRFQHIRNNHWQ